MDNIFPQLPEIISTTLWTILKIVAIVIPLMISVAYLTYFERRVIGFMQGRLGPNRVGYFGLLQPIADALKLMFKEIIHPTKSNNVLVSNKLAKNGLLTVPASDNVVRLAPPLIIKRKHVEEAIQIIEKSLI